jgi:predicted pyridoxine 5'-phosphate oxidase superfamily flavin-nucleotide-binding protein
MTALFYSCSTPRGENDPALIERLFDKGYKARPERAILFTIEAWDVNCSSHIVTRFTEAEVEQAFAAVKAKVEELQAENARLRSALSAHAGGI